MSQDDRTKEELLAEMEALRARLEVLEARAPAPAPERVDGGADEAEGIELGLEFDDLFAAAGEDTISNIARAVESDEQSRQALALTTTSTLIAACGPGLLSGVALGNFYPELDAQDIGHYVECTTEHLDAFARERVKRLYTPYEPSEIPRASRVPSMLTSHHAYKGRMATKAGGWLGEETGAFSLPGVSVRALDDDHAALAWGSELLERIGLLIPRSFGGSLRRKDGSNMSAWEIAQWDVARATFTRTPHPWYLGHRSNSAGEREYTLVRSTRMRSVTHEMAGLTPTGKVSAWGRRSAVTLGRLVGRKTREGVLDPVELYLRGHAPELDRDLPSGFIVPVCAPGGGVELIHANMTDSEGERATLVAGLRSSAGELWRRAIDHMQGGEGARWRRVLEVRAARIDFPEDQSLLRTIGEYTKPRTAANKARHEFYHEFAPLAVAEALSDALFGTREWVSRNTLKAGSDTLFSVCERADAKSSSRHLHEDVWGRGLLEKVPGPERRGMLDVVDQAKGEDRCALMPCTTLLAAHDWLIREGRESLPRGSQREAGYVKAGDLTSWEESPDLAGAHVLAALYELGRRWLASRGMGHLVTCMGEAEATTYVDPVVDMPFDVLLAMLDVWRDEIYAMWSKGSGMYKPAGLKAIEAWATAVRAERRGLRVEEGGEAWVVARMGRRSWERRTFVLSREGKVEAGVESTAISLWVGEEPLVYYQAARKQKRSGFLDPNTLEEPLVTLYGARQMRKDLEGSMRAELVACGLLPRSLTPGDIERWRAGHDWRARVSPSGFDRHRDEALKVHTPRTESLGETFWHAAKMATLDSWDDWAAVKG